MNKFIRSFKRITSGSSFIPEIDGLRFIAIVTVVILHTNTNYIRTYGETVSNNSFYKLIEPILNLGGVGVDIFFSISGFILAMPFAKSFLFGEPKPKLGNYYWRRVTRLEPPYLVSLIGLFICYVVFFNKNWLDYLDNLGASIIYSHYFIYGVWNEINPVAWSLETEVQFYIIAPFISILLFSNRIWIRRSAMILLIVALDAGIPHILGPLTKLHLSKSVINYLHSFLVGFMFLDFYLLELKNFGKNFIWDIIGVIGFALIFTNHPDFMESSRILFDIGVFALFTSVFKGKLLNYIFKLEWITSIGGMCYSIYLLHYPILFSVMIVLTKLGVNGSNVLLIFAVAILITLIISSVFYKLIEQPCMDKNWYKNIGKKNKIQN
jgi:peptidoglycan/LPS O-acetylase OafA/YrhL